MSEPPSDAPRDALDLRAIRDGGRRAIPWDAPRDPRLDPARAATLGRSWLHLARQEHLAVGAFAGLQSELAEVGCSSVVLALIARAGADEVRHADLCLRMAARYLAPGEVPARLAGVPRVPRHPSAPLRERALLHVVEMCCLNETFTGVYFTETLARADDPVARAAVESLLEDEIDHGRVGWAHLAACCREGWGQAVASAALPALLARAVGAIMGPATAARSPADPVLEGHALLHGAGVAALYRRALAEVVLPGFDAVGVDTAAARALVRERGWDAA